MNSSIAPTINQLHRMQLQANKLRTIADSEEEEAAVLEQVRRKGFVEKRAGFALPGVGSVLKKIKGTGTAARQAGSKAMGKIPTSAKVAGGVGLGAWGGNAAYNSEVRQAKVQKFLDQYYSR